QRSILITGYSAGGIGHAFVKEFHSRRLKVFAMAQSLRNGSKSSQRLAGVKLLKLDVTDIESIWSTRNEVASLIGGKLDILVNNAPFLEVNYFAPMSMVKEFLPLLLASDDACIVQTSSIGGFVHFPFNGAYNMSKSASNTFTDALGIELDPFEYKCDDFLQLVTGAVNSNIHRTRYLSDNSLYKPMERLAVRRQIGMTDAN
ncbi:hypothetical protein F5878DRAFT_687872, partial [Lentinula raphanica]